MNNNIVEKNRSNLFLRFLPLSGTTILFILIFRKVDLKQIEGYILNIQPYYFLSAVIISFISNIILGAQKWRYCLMVAGFRITLKQAFLMKQAFFPLTVVFPLKLGDILRIEYLNRRYCVPMEIGVASIIYDNLINIIVFLSIICIISPFYIISHASIWVILVPLPLFSSRIRRIIVTYFHYLPSAFRDIPQKAFLLFNNVTPKSFFALFMQAIIYKTASPILTSWLILRGLGIETVPFAVLCSSVLVIDLALALPVSVVGLGAREAAYVLIFAQYGEPALFVSVGIMASLVERIIPSISGLPFAYDYLKYREKRKKEN